MDADHLALLHQIPEAWRDALDPRITHSAALVYPVLPKGIKFPSTCSFLLPQTKGLLGGSPSRDTVCTAPARAAKLITDLA